MVLERRHRRQLGKVETREPGRRRLRL